MVGAREGAIDAAETHLGVSIPQPLRALYAEADGRYSRGGRYWVVRPLARVIEDNHHAWGEGTLPRHLLAFGDDGTGNPFCLSLSSPTDEVLRWNWLDRDVEVQEGTLHQFSRKWLADS